MKFSETHNRGMQRKMSVVKITMKVMHTFSHTYNVNVDLYVIVEKRDDLSKKMAVLYLKKKKVNICKPQCFYLQCRQKYWIW